MYDYYYCLKRHKEMMPGELCSNPVCDEIEARNCLFYGRCPPKKENNMSKTTDPNEHVDHPSHYNVGEYEVIDVIEDWDLGFNLGNAIKYIGRAGHKDDIIQDLEKARWYVDREIQRLKRKRMKLSSDVMNDNMKDHMVE